MRLKFFYQIKRWENNGEEKILSLYHPMYWSNMKSDIIKKQNRKRKRTEDKQKRKRKRTEDSEDVNPSKKKKNYGR